MRVTLCIFTLLAAVAFAQDTGQAPPQKANDRLPEMKTQNYSGTLVDASCVAAPGKSDADRSATSDQGQACKVSSTTSQFALKTSDGKTLQFDAVGNQRAQDAIKSSKSWTRDSDAGKPIHAKVSGVLSGDKLTVMSVH